MKKVVIDPVDAKAVPHEGCCCGPDTARRAALKAVVGVTLAAAAGVRGAAAAGADEAPPAKGDWLVKVNDDNNTPLTSADIKLGEKQIIVYPYEPTSKTLRDGSRLNRILVMKLDPSWLDDATKARAADGVVAYSAFCTHQGCDVSAWLPDEKNLMCFCHFSKFSPVKAGAVANGPAAKPLAALPLKVEDGKLVVADGFNIAPGKGA
jgi:rieske iron-sulfur protein